MGASSVLTGAAPLKGALAPGLTGCETGFTGSACVEGGRKGCESECRKNGLEIAGMLYMGGQQDRASGCSEAPEGNRKYTAIGRTIARTRRTQRDSLDPCAPGGH